MFVEVYFIIIGDINLYLFCLLFSLVERLLYKLPL